VNAPVRIDPQPSKPKPQAGYRTPLPRRMLLDYVAQLLAFDLRHRHRAEARQLREDTQP